MRGLDTTAAAHPLRLAASVAVLGLVLTLSSSWTAAQSNRDTEERLLHRQTAQAASVLATAVAAIEQRVRSTAELADEVGNDASGRAVLSDVLDGELGDGGLFVGASIWRQRPGGTTVFVSRGEAPLLGEESASALVSRAMSSDSVVVQRMRSEAGEHIAYAFADSSTPRGRATWAAYAERAIPADRRAPVDRDDAYQGLDYAIYLGTQTDPAQMTTTNVDPSRLPLSGTPLDATSVPFGDTVLTLTTTPRDYLGSGVSQRLPRFRLFGGLLITLLAALLTWQLSRARRAAEADTATIRSLYQQVDALYGEQRTLFVALQRALLPQSDPQVSLLEVAAEYVAGASGIDIGGDWYSVIRLDETRFAFVVGDVSGRGVDAVAEMARARFTLRAYLAEGDGPAEALSKCSRQFDVVVDDHIITVLAGVGDAASGDVDIASAGHPPPLVLEADGKAHFVPVPPGPPLGLGATDYTSTPMRLPAGGTLIGYTDGLVERRDQVLDERLAVLQETASAAHDQALPALVQHLLDTLRPQDAPDDIAVLALRRADRPA